MAENSKIEWTRHTWNPWVGCTALSPACDHCYAEVWSRRTGHPELWQGERRRTSALNWQQPVKWDRAAAAAGERHRVFCASLADFFDNQVPTRSRDDAWHRIAQTPNLDWMVLTKCPENIAKMLPGEVIGAPAWGEGWLNVWLGTTVEDRARLRRIDVLRRVPAAVRFPSIEPLLEDLGDLDLTGIHLVIVGGESGPKTRALHPAWVRSIERQCAVQGVAFFMKQWSEWAELDQSPAADEAGWQGRGDWMILSRERDLDIPDDRWPDADAGEVAAIRVGKKAAGRVLDGVEHNGMPEARA